MEIAGRHVLLTGATGGLGQAIAEALAARGARLVLSGRREEVLEPLAARLDGRAIEADLSARSDLDRLVEEAGQVDVLVANAALPGSGQLSGYEPEQIDRVLEVNLRAPIVLARRLMGPMVERGEGSLVFMSSLAGKAPTPGQSLYVATKFALRGFALALRGDLLGTGVGVTVITPGFIRDAGMFHESGAKLPPGLGTRAPADVARAVVRAITDSPPEIDVAPPTLRALSALSGLMPRTAERVVQRAGGAQIAEQFEEPQRTKR